MTDLVNLLKPGQRIFVAGSSNEPTALLQYMSTLPLPERLEFIQFPIGGYNDVDFTAWEPTAILTTFFMTASLRGADSSRLRFLPMQMREVFNYLSHSVDVCLLQVARDQHGTLRLGPNVDFVDAVLAQDCIVIAELNHNVVAPAGCPQIQAERIDYLFDSDRELARLPQPAIDDVAAAIGAHVASLVRDGDCIQTGIGAIPAAILQRLGDKNDLGMHGGLIDDGGMALIKNGNMNGSAKPVDRGLHIAGMALGSPELLAWLATETSVVFRGADYTHEVSVIRQLPNFVSVNSAVEIDLFGQVNAEFAGGRQISGTGGSVDFMRASKASRGGRSIVAMAATARGGSVSRIVDRVELVTALRTDVDIVVTEYGIARIKEASVGLRAEALAAIAAPQFRAGLQDGR